MTTSDRTACPYCNATVPGPGWTVCPRCGETAPGSANGVPHHDPARPATPADYGVVRGLAPVALIGGLLAVVVLVGFVAYFVRGPAAPPPTRPLVRSPAATIPPPGVPGLGRLPLDATVVAVVQPGPVLAYAKRSGTDPAAILRNLKLPTDVLDRLARAGVPLDQIHAITTAIVLADDDAVPRVTAVLTLLDPPADPAAVRDAVSIGGLPTESAEVDPHTFVFATRPADLTAAVARTGTGPGHLSGVVRTRLADLSPASFAWAVTDEVDWARKPSIALAAKLAKEADLPEQLAAFRSGAIGASFEPDPQLTLTTHARDDATADRLRDWFARQPEATVAGDGDIVRVELPFDPKAGWPDWSDLFPKARTE